MNRTAYKFRFYPTAEQKSVLAQVFGHRRYVWNWALDLRQTAYEEDEESLSYTDTSSKLTELKKENDWLYNVSSHVLQQSLRDLDQAYTNFFDHGAGHPNFKRKHGKASARYVGNGFTLEGKKLTLTKVPGVLNVRWSREFKPSTEVTSVTLTKDPSGRYFVSFCCKEEKEKLPRNNKITGVDFGIKDVAITSNGDKYPNPKHLDDAEYRLRKAQKRLSRKEQGSQNWKRQKKRVARLHAEVKDKRKDYLHKLSRKLVDESQVIVLENLNVEGMKQNRSLARAVSDVGLGRLKTYVKYKADWAGRTVLEADQWFPSSQLCSAKGCDGRKRDLDLSDRTWTCAECGCVHDRDQNAALNLKALGTDGLSGELSSNGSGEDGKTVRALVRGGTPLGMTNSDVGSLPGA